MRIRNGRRFLWHGDRQYGPDQSAATWSAENFERAIQMFDAFARSGNPDAKRTVFPGCGTGGWQPAAVILDLGEDRSAIRAHTDDNGRTTRITMDVREGFLDNGKNSAFNFLGKAAEAVNDLDGGIDTAAFRKSTDIPA